MKDRFVDHNLKISSSLYETACIPIRLTIALIFLSGIIPLKFLPYIALLFLFTAFGLYRKSQVSGNSWKCYQRAILVYTLIALMIFINMYKPIPNVMTVIGVLMVVDVLMGIQSKHVFEKLG